MCNCINEIELKINVQFQNDTKCEDFVRAELENKTLFISSGNVELSSFSEVKYKNGKQHKKWKKYVKFTYCPFYGVKYDN
jgi:hypothetical protein